LIFPTNCSAALILYTYADDFENSRVHGQCLYSPSCWLRRRSFCRIYWFSCWCGRCYSPRLPVFCLQFALMLKKNKSIAITVVFIMKRDQKRSKGNQIFKMVQFESFGLTFWFWMRAKVECHWILPKVTQTLFTRAICFQYFCLCSSVNIFVKL